MSNRPKRATGKGDENHGVVTNFLKYTCGGFEVAPLKDANDQSVRGSVQGYAAYYRGYRVAAIDTSKSGGLLTDWIVSVDGKVSRHIEVKTPTAYKKDGHSLTPGEKWTAENCGVSIVVTEEDVRDVIDEMLAVLRPSADTVVMIDAEAMKILPVTNDEGELLKVVDAKKRKCASISVKRAGARKGNRYAV